MHIASEKWSGTCDWPDRLLRPCVIQREPGAEMVNPYNEHLLRAWRANMDVQVVGSVHGGALYVTHYICKNESQVLKQVIAEQLASLQQDATVQRLRRLATLYLVTAS